MSDSTPLRAKFHGPYACFTRPEYKVERVSYDVPTPSAARGMLEAIFWKPEMDYLIQKIYILNKIQHFSIWRNEISITQSESSAKGWANTGIGGYFADDDRVQRHTLGLKDVAYIIEAQIKLRPHATANIAKYRDQFRRRVKRGQCHHQPYFGTREFTAFFEAPLTPDNEVPSGAEAPIQRSDTLGLMLYDLQFVESPEGKLQYRCQDAQGKRIATGQARPHFFPARLQNGVLVVTPPSGLRQEAC